MGLLSGTSALPIPQQGNCGRTVGHHGSYHKHCHYQLHSRPPCGWRAAGEVKTLHKTWFNAGPPHQALRAHKTLHFLLTVTVDHCQGTATCPADHYLPKQAGAMCSRGSVTRVTINTSRSKFNLGPLPRKVPGVPCSRITTEGNLALSSIPPLLPGC